MLEKDSGKKTKEDSSKHPFACLNPQTRLKNISII